MIETLISLFLAFNLSVETGYAAYYNPQVFEQVVNVRLAGWTANGLTDDDVRGVIGYVAVLDCDEIGRRVWLFHQSEGFSGPYLVADCCCDFCGDCERMERRKIVCEVDFNTAARWQVLGKGPQDINVAVIRLRRGKAKERES